MAPGLIFGIHAVARRLREAPADCFELYCLPAPRARLDELVRLARAAGVRVSFHDRRQLNELAGTDKHQGCILRTAERAPTMSFEQCLNSIDENSLILVLDGVQDRHNLGACLRTADACGVDGVVIPRDRSARLNATVRKVAAGAAETVPLIEVTNLVRSLAQLKRAGVWIYGASGDAAESFYDHAFDGPVALVMGAEGRGLRRLTAESCDHLLRLPMHGRVESLNVSVATGVCLYEILRSRGAASS